jgi:hypothetical protein
MAYTSRTEENKDVVFMDWIQSLLFVAHDINSKYKYIYIEYNLEYFFGCYVGITNIRNAYEKVRTMATLRMQLKIFLAVMEWNCGPYNYAVILSIAKFVFFQIW